ncbi:MAG: arylsulfatase [Bacteroidota bacterium]
MQYKEYIYAKFFVPLFFGFLTSCQTTNQHISEAAQRPNVLIILVDDMGYSDLSCYGSEIATPNIDALAMNGMRMMQFYNAARCCPSRASLLTGLYPHQAGMGHQNKDLGVPSYSGKIRENAVTIAEVLQEEDYKTYQVGKWHVGSEALYRPGNKGFDEYFALIEGAMSYYNQWPWVRNQDTLRMTYNGKPYHTDSDFFATDTFSDSASSFIERHNTKQPFFMYLAYNAPHWPLHAKPEDIALYKGKYAVGWDSIRTIRHQRMVDLGIISPEAMLSERFQTVPAWESLSDSAKFTWANKMELYAAVMHRLDLGVGKVVEALKKSNQLENTVILFLSDNGACQEDPTGPWSIYPEDGEPGSVRSFPAYLPPWANVSNTPYRYFKSFLHEGGIITPFIAHYPNKIQAGQINDNTVGHIMDIMPTVLDLADASYPKTFNNRNITATSGISLLPSLVGEEHTGHKQLFWEHQFNKAVRQGDWKLVAAYKVLGEGILNEWELYNLKTDPIEQHNLAKQHPDKVAELARLYDNWADKVQALDKTTLDSLKKRM